jgi:hypothetical protein
MRQRHSRKANSSSASHEIPRTLWKPEGSLELSQETATCPYPGPDQSIPRPPNRFTEDLF